MNDIIEGRSIYLRFNNGPIQHFRVWNTARFIQAQVDIGVNHENDKGEPDPIIVKVMDEKDYRFERGWK